MPKDYEYVEHTADLRFRSYGESLDSCYANAARAMYAAVVDPSSVSPSVERAVSISAPDLPALMHDWLSEALLFLETEMLVFSVFGVSVKKAAGGGYALAGTLKGEEFDRKKHTILAEIKAVTYHELTVKEEKGVWVAEVLCDI